MTEMLTFYAFFYSQFLQKSNIFFFKVEKKVEVGIFVQVGQVTSNVNLFFRPFYVFRLRQALMIMFISFIFDLIDKIKKKNNKQQLEKFKGPWKT